MTTSLAKGPMGVDPRKFQVVRSCLEAVFADVNLDESNQRFVFNDGKQSSELVFARVLLDDIRIHQLGWLKAHMAMKIIPALKANPGKKVSVNNSGTYISEKDPV
jgi:hypothetical protein